MARPGYDSRSRMDIRYRLRGTLRRVRLPYLEIHPFAHRPLVLITLLRSTSLPPPLSSPPSPTHSAKPTSPTSSPSQPPSSPSPLSSPPWSSPAPPLADPDLVSVHPELGSVCLELVSVSPGVRSCCDIRRSRGVGRAGRWCVVSWCAAS